MTQMSLYWITRLDSIKESEVALAFPGVLLFLAATIMFFIGHFDDVPKARKFSVPMAIVGFMLAATALCIDVFVPTTKEMAFIVVVPQLTAAIQSSKVAQKMPGKLLELADSWIDELAPAGKRKGKP